MGANTSDVATVLRLPRNGAPPVEASSFFYNGIIKLPVFRKLRNSEGFDVTGHLHYIQFLRSIHVLWCHCT